MTINDIINIKGWAQDVDNTLRRDFEGIKKPLGESERPFYALVKLVVQGKVLFEMEQMSDRHYCHDCSHDHGTRITHSSNPVFQEFRNKPLIVKYAESLNELNQKIY